MSDAIIPTDGSSAVVPVDRLREELVIAQETGDIARFQRVIAAADSAASLQRKIVRLAAEEGQPFSVVLAATQGLQEAATVCLEAQVEAGRTLKTMQERGERAPRGAGGHRANVAQETLPTLEELGVTRTHAYKWQKVAEIPDDVRVQYLDEMRQLGNDITAKGLLRYVAEPKVDERSTFELGFVEVIKALATIPKYDPSIMAGHASATKQVAKLRKLADEVESWTTEVLDIFNRSKD